MIVFIIGCPRSGTTWLGNLLGEQKDIKYYNEPGELSWLGKKEITKEDNAHFIKTVTKYNNAKHIVLKFPHWTLFIEELEVMFPEAKFIHIIRNPEDVCKSLYKVRIVNPETNYHNAWFLYQFDMGLLIKYRGATWFGKDWITWEHYTSKAFKAKEFGPGRYIEIKYEDLVADQEKELLRLIEWLN